MKDSVLKKYTSGKARRRRENDLSVEAEAASTISARSASCEVRTTGRSCSNS